ncbi:Suf-domain-containing protein [Dendrothele bispora CBS 962.96]|uniref:mRNA 3'-end-processing protein RNA14 n=1 Tax=Dendrothele bispora (strain CBS 962.96) TaxID=1314807 RepID=A0A4S8LI85_DENBC|nr:Suf-domain-containing protein [Dendrothele bispora CBS 962.96]
MKTTAAPEITLPKNDRPTASTKPTEFDLLRARLQKYPFDVAGWQKFIVCAEDSGDIEKVKTAYEDLLKHYPHTSTVQISYIKHFSRSGTFDQVEHLFERFFKGPKSVELLRFYLSYIRRKTSATDTIRKAYEFVLSRVGHERDSGDIWASYITFLNAERPLHYLPTLPTFTPSERQLVGKWKAYLKWEESDPLGLQETETALLHSRISRAYQKAVVQMRYFPEIWFMAYTRMNNIGRHHEAIQILKTGMDANPASFVLNFAHIDLLESKREFQEVHNAFDRFLDVLRKNLEIVHKEASTASVHEPSDSDTEPGELMQRKQEYGLVWIMYLRFGRRAEGVQTARMIFAKARQCKFTPWQVYEAAASTEYHCFGEKEVAIKIFNLGMKLYSDDMDFVLKYFRFLISLNDENNAQALFEGVVSACPPEHSKILWQHWSSYQYQYGTFEATQKLEKRMMQVFPEDPPIKRFAQRYTYLDIDAVASRDIGFAIAKHHERLGTSNTGFLKRQREECSDLGLDYGQKKEAQSDRTKRQRTLSPHPTRYTQTRDVSRDDPADPSHHVEPREYVVDFEATATSAQSAKREEDRKSRWKKGVGMFSKWSDLQRA